MNSLPLVTFSKVRISAQVVLCAGLAITTCTASGQTFWQANPAIVGNWSTASNWTLGVPNASSGTTFDAVIANGGTAQLLVTGGSVRRLRVGRIEGSGGLYVESGGGLNVTENLHINEGGAGFASMYVEGGGDVTAPATVVGYSSSGSSQLTVTGAGSTYTATSSFIVGRAGIGTFVLSAGGSLAVGGGASPLQIATLAGSSGTAYIGNGAAAGTLSASGVQFGAGTGSFWFNHTDNITFAIPIFGTGSLFKTGTGTATITANNSYIGGPLFDAGTDIQRGTLDVTGKIAHPNTNLEIGTWPAETAALLVRNGGTVKNASGRIGDGINSIGSATVDGPGTTWTNTAELRVGHQGPGTLAITNAANVTNVVGYIGYSAGSTGSVTIDGTGSTWTNNSRLFVGTSGSGSLSVTGGGQVSNFGDADIAYGAGSSGTATIDGTGSAWTISDNGGPAGLYVGYGGTGSLSVTNGGVINATQAANGVRIESHGTLSGDGTINGRVTNSAGIVAPGTSAGTLHINGIYTQEATGTLRIELASLSSYDKLQFNAAFLNGTLDVVNLGGFAPQAGHSFDILDWNPGFIVANTFATVNLPALGGSLDWDTSQLYITGVVSVGRPGDFNNDGTVDAADYVVWRKTDGTPAAYNLWRSNFGQPAGSSARTVTNAAVPEPSSQVMLFLATAGWCLPRRRST